MKRMLSMLLVLAITLTGCSSVAGMEKNTPGKVAEQIQDAIGNSVAGIAKGNSGKTAEHIQAAIDNSGLVSRRGYGIIPGVGVFTVNDVPKDNLRSAALHDPKKLVVSVSGYGIFALTHNGDLYHGYDKIAEHIVDGAYSDTNVNERASFVSEDGKYYRAYATDGEPVKFQPYEKYSNVLGVSAGRGSFFAFTKDKVLYEGSEKEDWPDCSADDWKNVAVLAAAKEMKFDNSDFIITAATIAGLTHDGQTLATGTYADDILAWGDLSYISMYEGLLVGLSTDGTLRLTGEAGKYLAENSDVTSWSNLITVCAGQDYLSAVDTEGNYYFQHYSAIPMYVGECVIINQEGVVSRSESDTSFPRTCELYTTDGFVYSAYTTGSLWTDENDTPLSGKAASAPTDDAETSSNLPEEFTKESITAFFDELYADLKPSIEAQDWEYYINVHDGEIRQIGFETYVGDPDIELMTELIQRLSHSGLLNLSAGAQDAVDNFGYNLGDRIEADGWVLDYVDTPSMSKRLYFQ